MSDLLCLEGEQDADKRENQTFVEGDSGFERNQMQNPQLVGLT